MRVAIVENMAGTPHGQVGVALHEAAAVVEVYRPWRDGVLPQANSFDALISFGGEQSALDDATSPYLPHLADLMARSADDGTAVLGICLGSQVLARGLGATNRLGVAREFGWTEISRLAEPDPVLGALPDQFPIFEWHSDTFTLPPGATHLATSPVALVQGFRFGRAGYGTQFHFEASRAVARHWISQYPEATERMSPGYAARLPELEQSHGIAADQHGLAIARGMGRADLKRWLPKGNVLIHDGNGAWPRLVEMAHGS